MTAKLDASFEDHGSVWLVRPLTDEAKRWLADNIGEDAQWFGDALAVEPRFVQGVIEGMQLDGLEVGL
jgi:hypothetical protein